MVSSLTVLGLELRPERGDTLFTLPVPDKDIVDGIDVPRVVLLVIFDECGAGALTGEARKLSLLLRLKP